jgi:hypothetical protein
MLHSVRRSPVRLKVHKSLAAEVARENALERLSVP